MWWRVLCHLVLCYQIAVSAQLQCSLITPSVLHVDNEETLVVTVNKYPSDMSHFAAILTVSDYPQNKYNLVKKTIVIRKENGFSGTVKMIIPSTTLGTHTENKQFVYVTLNSGNCYLEKVVLASHRAGYIFVQTDKPIYTPGSQVLYRIFTTSLSLDPVNKPVAIEFKTPDNVIVEQAQLQTDKSGILSKSFTLTNPASLGVWIISAKYKDSPAQDYKTNFEVKEYVLPSFEIKIIPNKKYFLSCDEEFKVKILAKYVYGKPVTGTAIVQFGAKKDSKDTSRTISLERIQINNGEGVAILKRQTIVDMLPVNSRLLEWKLSVSVTVITDSGSELQETQLNDIHIVESPYKIDFIKTPKYFTPGMPYYFTVLVTNPDESPAAAVNVVALPGLKKGRTKEDGTIRLSIDTETDGTLLQVIVLTSDANLADNQQASAIMEAIAYQSPDKNYLYLSIQTGQVKLQENIYIDFNVKSNKELLNRNVYYLILNKGRIIQAGRLIQQSQTVMSETFPITKDLLPSFRIVAYYVVDGSGEVVADSVWVDVEDTCAGTLQLKPFKDSDTREQQPGAKMNLKLRADHQASVGLVAVDKAVYALNNKLKFSQSKVWKWIEKHDIGCTAGSGADALGVFYDAGLTLQTSFGSTTAQRIEPFCQGNRKVKRRKRDTEELTKLQNLKASEYAGLQQSCCVDGMRENPTRQSCEDRSRLIQDGKNCIDAFLDCCKHIERKRPDIISPPILESSSVIVTSSILMSQHEVIEISRTGEGIIIEVPVEGSIEDSDDELEEDSDDEFMEDSEIAIRTAFPESWLWETQLMNEEPDENGISTKILHVSLKDSITTWEVLAVSLSKGNGICVSDPYNIVARKDFFIDLKLPYSIVRNEQVEIRAILYNYGNADIRVRVQWTYNEKFCSPSTARKIYSRIVIVKADSSMVIPYVIVPLEVGSHEIEVKAAGQFVSDGVRKNLKVVPEGKLIVRTLKSVVLNPEVMARDGVQDELIPAVDPTKVVPLTEVTTIVTIQGLPISEMVQQSIDGINLNHLINLPSGCGEQNMMRLTSPVIATHFLDITGQWERVGVDRRAQAIQHINAGISQQLAYRKKEASYSSFQRTLGSTWLTAYVVRIFSLASSLTDVDKGGLCESVKWLIVNKQNYEGLFREDAPVFQTYIMGGLEKSSDERNSALTAFVLLAILDSATICTGHVNNLQTSIDKASSYISQQYQSLENPYSIAIASYALAKTEKLHDINKLMSASTEGNHWNEEGYREITIESTSYALLTLLKMGEYKKASPLAQWLAEERFFGEFYGSTQATIMMFQALAQYYKDMPKQGDVNMDITYNLPGKSDRITQKINVNNLMVARTDQVSTSGEFTVTAKGKGQGTLTVNAIYYAKPEENQNKCNNFKLDVNIKNEAPDKDQEAEATVSMEICTRFLESRDAAMSIMEISMMTGFVPDITTLNKLNSDRTFSKFEINKNAVDKEMLILYFDKIQHEGDLCLNLKLHQYFEIGYIQPASVTVYEYYAKENRCTQYYHVNEDSKLLKKICVGNLCRCTEENCFVPQQIPVSSSMRYVKATEAAVNYVYKTTLKDIKNEVNYVIYVMTIKLVLREGIDHVTVNEERHFISHKKCPSALNLEIDQDYLIWGIAKDSWLLASKYSYVITKDTWIEKWPKDKECQEAQNQQLCSDLNSFKEALTFSQQRSHT